LTRTSFAYDDRIDREGLCPKQGHQQNAYRHYIPQRGPTQCCARSFRLDTAKIDAEGVLHKELRIGRSSDLKDPMEDLLACSTPKLGEVQLDSALSRTDNVSGLLLSLGLRVCHSICDSCGILLLSLKSTSLDCWRDSSRRRPVSVIVPSWPPILDGDDQPKAASNSTN
jgi:hypothetical protein